MVRVLHDDWPIGLGENTSYQTLKHLAAMLYSLLRINIFQVRFKITQFFVYGTYSDA